MDFGVVPQWLKVSHALHSTRDGFFVEDPLIFQCDIQLESLFHKALEYFQLDLAHDLHMDLSALPQQMELRIFLFQQPQLGQHGQGVFPLGQRHPVSHDRLQYRRSAGRLRAQTLSGVGGGKTGNGNGLPSESGLNSGKFLTGVKPQLQRLFF